MSRNQNNNNGHQENQNMEQARAQFQQMLAPASKAQPSRKAWGIDVSMVWMPYLTAGKAAGAFNEDELPDTALGAPIRVARDKDSGEVKFGKNGRPSLKVAPEVQAMVKRHQEQYIANLLAQANAVAEQNPEAYQAQVASQQVAARPLLEKDDSDVQAAEDAMREQAAQEQAAQEQGTPEPAAQEQAAQEPVTVA